MVRLLPSRRRFGTRQATVVDTITGHVILRGTKSVSFLFFWKDQHTVFSADCH